jgi:hypothetical protein
MNTVGVNLRGGQISIHSHSERRDAFVEMVLMMTLRWLPNVVANATFAP